MTGTTVRRRSSGRRSDDDVPVDAVHRIAERALWIAVRMIHEANVVRDNPDGLKVGGHQASSASVASILATLYASWLRPGDLVSIKPHASPLYHALTYLMGALDASYLATLRSFGGLQAYPSRTKDPDRVDFSTGSVGLGAVAPLFAALADRYLRHHGMGPQDAPERRFIAVVGDAELDEGNVWEAVAEPALAGLGNVTWIVDLNRQSLDRVVPGIRVQQMARMFEAAGWQVISAKYGSRLAGLMAGTDGPPLRRRIDDMPNEEYQALIRRSGTEARAQCIEGAPPAERDAVARALEPLADEEVPGVLGDLGGHDPVEIRRALQAAADDTARPSVIFAYTIKGWKLPFAGDAMNHSALLTAAQVRELAPRLGCDPDDPWARFPDGSPEAAILERRGRELDLRHPYRRSRLAADESSQVAVPSVDIRIAQTSSTQTAFGDALAAMARDEAVRPRVVTTSPDVTISTGLGGWVNRVGVFSPREERRYDDTPRLLTWAPRPLGQHIELGISEMNLFMLLSQFGLSRELFRAPLVPIGTVYDPFIARGLDALIYALYVGARFILVGTPSGVSLAPEGGAHQSALTTSIGVELPGLRSYEPAFGQEVVWLLEDAVAAVQRDDGHASYLRLTTRTVDQSLAEPVATRLGPGEWRRQVLEGGYRLLEPPDDSGIPAGAPAVSIVSSGALVPEAVEAVRALWVEEVAASLVVVTSADLLSAEMHRQRLAGVRDRRGGLRLGHLDTLFPPRSRRAPLVTVHDGSPHALAFLGGAFGAPVVPLGVDQFGQSGRLSDLYRHTGVDAEHIFEAALLALDLAVPDG